MKFIEQINRQLPQLPCPECDGGGVVPLGEHFVTQDMAIDAGEPDMAGMSMGIEYGPCPYCGGHGWVDGDEGPTQGT